MKTLQNVTLALCMLAFMAACGEKKKSEVIITQRTETPRPKEPVRMQEYTDERDVKWLGRTYHVAINRQPSDSLPMVKDENGQQYVDNVFTVSVSRDDGTVFFSHVFTKKSIVQYLDDDFRTTGVFEGLVYDKVEKNCLLFAASVGHPQTDEYIPLVISLSRMGELTVRRDTELDTTAPAAEQEDDEV